VAQAGRELEQATSYDHVVVNDVLDQAVAAVEAIIDGEAAPTLRQPELNERVEQLRRELAAMAT